MKRFAETNFTPCKSPKVSSALSDNSSFSRMKVCVRVRPFSQKEVEAGSKSMVDVIDKNLLVFDPYVYDQTNDQYQYQGKMYKEIGKKPNKNLQFVFDRVFDDSENNLTVYQETTKDLVTSLLNGYNCSIFAYGSTGSGKTHTMLGSKNDPGVIFFTTMDLFEQIEQESNKNLELSISYFEIYNEVFYDLLDPTSGRTLSVLEDGNRGMTIKNLSIHQPKDADHLLEMLEFGNKNRKQHPTDANAESSRSHAIFQISLRRKDFSNEQEMSIQVSKMSLVDLAGSERASVAYKTYRNNGLHREGGNINKSLLSLGNCINALSNENQKNGYIPYRSSKLTLILRDSLGGNCQTLMIATVSSSATKYEETHNTLLYAERAKGVQLNARRNNLTVSVQPRDYKHMFEKMNIEKNNLLKQIESMKEEMEKYKSKSIPTNPINSSSDAVEKLNSVKNILDKLFSERNDFRDKLLECEHNIKLLELRLLFRKYDSERLKILEDIDSEDIVEMKSHDPLHSIYSQKLHYSNMKVDLEQKVNQNEREIEQYRTELLEMTHNDIVVQSYFLHNDCISQNKDYNFSEKHIKDTVKEMFGKFESIQDLFSSSFVFVHKAYHILNGLGQLSEDMESKFKSIIQKTKGKKTVAWKDNIESPTIAKMKEIVDVFHMPVYMGQNSTPSQKRSLVAVRDITPIDFGKTKTVFQNKTNLGNTITKSKSIAIVSPAIGISFKNENHQPFYPKSPSGPYRPMRNTWNKRFNSNSGKGRNFNFNYNNNNNNNYHSSDNIAHSYKRNNTFNPNYNTTSSNFSRPKFRF